ncbi:MAG: hypothetical protein K2M52_00555 [Paramuribaculum sp.]|nr:hypothetical protein [Paramuribaculum sp.]MDE7451804.1 hypothetical protein [Paramuribaculum sp.]
MTTCTEIAPGAAVMAHSIIFEGKRYPLSIARHLPDGSLSIKPYTIEMHTTEFINGTVAIEKKSDGRYCVIPQKHGDIEARR